MGSITLAIARPPPRSSSTTSAASKKAAPSSTKPIRRAAMKGGKRPRRGCRRKVEMSLGALSRSDTALGRGRTAGGRGGNSTNFATGRTVNLSTVVNYLGPIASIVSLPAAVITVVAALQTRGALRNIILWTALPLAIAAYTLDISDRLGWINLSRPGHIVIAYGKHDSALFMIVNSQQLLDYKDDYKMMLFLHVPYADIDNMTDTAIEKSAMFTITGAATNIAIPIKAPVHLRVIPPPNTKIGNLFSIPVTFSLVVLPNNTATEQIRSLSDVERVQGKIIETDGRDIEFEGAK
jgi:hypothetical protein